MLLRVRSRSTPVLLMVLPLAALASSATAEPLSAADKPARRIANASTTSPAAGLADVPTPDHPTVPAIRIARSVARTLDDVADYEATFIKRERVGDELIHQTMQMKVRHKPFSVYLKYLTDHPGREVIYVEGKNDDQLLVHEGEGLTALVGTISLDPDGPVAMRENRYPITQIGMRRLIDMVVEAWEKEARYGETEVRFYPNARLGKIACKVIEWSHPVRRDDLPFHKCRLYIDRTTNLPVRIENYGWPADGSSKPPLLEEYTYLNVRTNVGLTDTDFDPENREYGF